jgi:protein-tyrosine phosphatase
MVHLETIHPNLFLSDFDWAVGRGDGGMWDRTGKVWTQRYGAHSIQTVVHIQKPGSRAWTWSPRGYEDLVHINFEMADDRGLYTYREFLQIVHRISVSLAKHLRKGPLLIHCEAGTNRSVCAILAYAMRKSHMDLNTAVQYIEQAKNEAFPNRIWDTLTNKTFRAFMGQLETDILSRV